MFEAQSFPALHANVTARLMPMVLQVEESRGAEIMRAVCREFGVTISAIRSPRQHASLVNARQMFMLLAREYAKHLSFRQIGDMVRRDHTTVVYGAEKAAEKVASEEWYAAQRRRILARLAYEQ